MEKETLYLCLRIFIKHFIKKKGNVSFAGGGKLLMPDQGHLVMLLERWGQLRTAHTFSVFYSGEFANSCPFSHLEGLLLSTSIFPISRVRSPLLQNCLF